MEIKIDQKRFSLESKYTILIDGIEKCNATSKLFKWFAEINFESSETHELKYTIKRKWAWFKFSYDITNNKQIVYEFRTLSFWKRHYQCIINNDNYEIFGHKGRKYSVYKNNKMIACWEINKVTWFEGDKYRILADNNVDPEIISCFCILLDNANSDNKRDAMNWNIGWLGPEVKPFDETWFPR